MARYAVYGAYAVPDPTDPTDDMHLFIALGWLARMVAAACGDVQALWYGLACLAGLTLWSMYSHPMLLFTLCMAPWALVQSGSRPLGGEVATSRPRWLGPTFRPPWVRPYGLP